MASANLNGVELHYETAGGGERIVLTHGSWTDGDTWDPVIEPLAERYEVVTWDRRGHSRSGNGIGPGSRAQDTEDLVALLEHLGGPAHLVGSSYGALVVLGVVATRPEMVSSAALHEPPALTLLDGDDPRIAGLLADVGREVGAVLGLIEQGHTRAAAERFIDRVALGPGSWERLPMPTRDILAANAATFLDEERDPGSRSVDAAALAGAPVPILLTTGTASPAIFGPIVAALAGLLPNARVRTVEGAGHIPHATHPEQWLGPLLDFYREIGGG